jgi:hypothetical protein
MRAVPLYDPNAVPEGESVHYADVGEDLVGHERADAVELARVLPVAVIAAVICLSAARIRVSSRRNLRLVRTTYWLDDVHDFRICDLTPVDIVVPRSVTARTLCPRESERRICW